MKKRRTRDRGLAVLTITIVALAVGCASVGTVDLQPDDPEAMRRVERRLHEVLDAAMRKDFDRLESYHAYGSKFTRFSTSSATRQDAASTRKIERAGLALLAGLKMRADDLKVDVFGNVAITTFILDYSFDTASGTVHRRERSTLVFVDEGGDLKIVHEHLSLITPPEPGVTSGAQPIGSETNRTSSPTGFSR